VFFMADSVRGEIHGTKSEIGNKSEISLERNPKENNSTAAPAW
jgi:hypothetical protein